MTCAPFLRRHTHHLREHLREVRQGGEAGLQSHPLQTLIRLFLHETLGLIDAHLGYPSREVDAVMLVYETREIAAVRTETFGNVVYGNLIRQIQLLFFPFINALLQLCFFRETRLMHDRTAFRLIRHAILIYFCRHTLLLLF